MLALYLLIYKRVNVKKPFYFFLELGKFLVLVSNFP